MSTQTYDPQTILNELRDGWPQQDVARRYGVSKSLVSRLAVTNGLRRRSTRPEQPCSCCGTTTRSTRRICRQCQEADLYPQPTAADALTNGEWVLDPRRRVLVWRELEDAQ